MLRCMDTQKTDWLQARRQRAWELKQEGWSQRRIAQALGVTEGAVSQWMRAVRDGGPDSLQGKARLGPKRRLPLEELEKLPELLRQGAEALGFRGEVWTRRRVAALLRSHFGVSYDPRHVGKLLARLGWTVQKPIRRARQRKEEAIEQWR